MGIKGQVYSGGLIKGVVVDIAGVEFAPDIPLFDNHINEGATSRHGDVTMQNSAENVIFSADIYDTPFGAVIQDRYDKNFKQQVSFGGDYYDFESLQEPEVINGRDWPAGTIVVRKCLIRELSLVGLGADINTFSEAASAGGVRTFTLTEQIETNKHENEYINSNHLTENNKMELNEAKFKELETNLAEMKGIIENNAVEVQNSIDKNNTDFDKKISELKICVENVQKNKSGSQDPNGDMVDALLIRAGVPVNNSNADALLRDGWNLHTFLGSIAGKHVDAKNFCIEVKNAWSTATTPVMDVLLGTIQKSIKVLVSSVTDDILMATDITSVSDYNIRQVFYTSGGSLKKLPNGGEIKHLPPYNTGHQVKLEDYAGMINLTNQDIADGNLNLAVKEAQKLTVSHIFTINDIVVDILDSIPAAYTLTNNPLSYAGLQAAATKLNETAINGVKLGLRGRFLIVSAADEFIARRLVGSQSLGAVDGQGDANPFYGYYQVIVNPYLPAGEWYLLTDPMVAPGIAVLLLNGMRTTTVESATAEFNKLGISIRGVFAFGAALGLDGAIIKNTPTA